MPDFSRVMGHSILHSSAKETSSSNEALVSLTEGGQELPIISVAKRGMRNVTPSR